jgi:hypothetical protein
MLLWVLRVLLLCSICRIWAIRACTYTFTTRTRATVLLRGELGILRFSDVGVLHTGIPVVRSVGCGWHGRRTGEMTFDHSGRTGVTGVSVPRVGVGARTSVGVITGGTGVEWIGVVEEEGRASEGGGVEGVAI